MSAWGDSWASAWGVSWGGAAVQAPAVLVGPVEVVALPKNLLPVHEIWEAGGIESTAKVGIPTLRSLGPSIHSQTRQNSDALMLLAA